MNIYTFLKICCFLYLFPSVLALARGGGGGGGGHGGGGGEGGGGMGGRGGEGNGGEEGGGGEIVPTPGVGEGPLPGEDPNFKPPRPYGGVMPTGRPYWWWSCCTEEFLKDEILCGPGRYKSCVSVALLPSILSSPFSMGGLVTMAEVANERISPSVQCKDGTSPTTGHGCSRQPFYKIGRVTTGAADPLEGTGGTNTCGEGWTGGKYWCYVDHYGDNPPGTSPR